MPSPEGGAATLEPGAAEWQASVEQAETETPPTEPLIDVAAAEAVSAEIKERERAEPLKAFHYAQEQVEKEVAERYNLNDKSAFKRLSGQCKAYFAGEFRDLKLSQELAERVYRGEIIPAEFDQIIKDNYRLAGKEGLRRLGKVVAKTGVSGGIGAAITAGLGGAIGSPIFLTALGVGAIARGTVEVVRHIKPQERNARAEVVKQRAAVLSEALKYQDRAGKLADELLNTENPATSERQQEIRGELDSLKEYLIRLTNYESAQSVNPQTEPEGLAKVRTLSKEKMAFEKKREKTADLITAGASFVSGAAYGVVHELLTSNHQTATEAGKLAAEKAHGFVANFGGAPGLDQGGHFIDKIDPSTLDPSMPGYHQLLSQLKDSGNYVFHYTPNGEAVRAVDFAVKHHATLSQFVLKDGSMIHTLKGMSDGLFQKLLVEHYSQLGPHVVATTMSFWKEILPLVGAQLLWLASEFRSKKSATEQPITRVQPVAPQSSISPPYGHDEHNALAEERRQEAEGGKRVNPGENEAKPEQILEGEDVESSTSLPVNKAEEAPKPSPEAKRSPVLKLPEGYEDWKPNDLFHWLESLPDRVEASALQNAGVEIGKSDDVAFIRFIDQGGWQHILGADESVAPDSKIRFAIKKVNPKGQEHRLLASQALVDSFARNLLWNINEVIRHGPPKKELNVEPEEVTEADFEELNSIEPSLESPKKAKSKTERTESDDDAKQKKPKPRIEEAEEDLDEGHTIPKYNEVASVPISKPREQENPLTQSLGEVKGANVLEELRRKMAESEVAKEEQIAREE